MKQLYKFWFCLAAAAAAAAATSLAASAAVATNGVIQIQGDLGDASAIHHFVYYPDQQVYYMPSKHVYCWNQDGTWVTGPDLPPTVTLGNSISFDTDEAEPWLHQDVIAIKYPAHFYVHHYDHYHHYSTDDEN